MYHLRGPDYLATPSTAREILTDPDPDHIVNAIRVLWAQEVGRALRRDFLEHMTNVLLLLSKEQGTYPSVRLGWDHHHMVVRTLAVFGAGVPLIGESQPHTILTREFGWWGCQAADAYGVSFSKDQLVLAALNHVLRLDDRTAELTQRVRPIGRQ